MYTLNTQAARQADTSGAQIKELGKYVGEFIQAKAIVSKKTGTKGIEFIFKSNGGQKANLSIYTLSASGEQYQGYDALMAIMTCMSLRGIKPVQGKATRYDYDAKKEVTEDAQIFPDLCKPIGILLETEDYTNGKGTESTRVVLKNVFQAGTELTASEILDKKTVPQTLEKMVAGLRHRPNKTKPKAPMTTAHDDFNYGGDQSGFNHPDDDSSIPF